MLRLKYIKMVTFLFLFVHPSVSLSLFDLRDALSDHAPCLELECFLASCFKKVFFKANPWVDR